MFPIRGNFNLLFDCISKATRSSCDSPARGQRRKTSFPPRNLAEVTLQLWIIPSSKTVSLADWEVEDANGTQYRCEGSVRKRNTQEEETVKSRWEWRRQRTQRAKLGDLVTNFAIASIDVANALPYADAWLQTCEGKPNLRPGFLRLQQAGCESRAGALAPECGPATVLGDT